MSTTVWHCSMDKSICSAALAYYHFVDSAMRKGNASLQIRSRRDDGFICKKLDALRCARDIGSRGLEAG